MTQLLLGTYRGCCLCGGFHHEGYLLESYKLFQLSYSKQLFSKLLKDFLALLDEGSGQGSRDLPKSLKSFKVDIDALLLMIITYGHSH